MNYEDALTRAIKNKIAPDIMTTMRDCEAIELYAPTKNIQVPLLADVNLAYNKKLAHFTLEGYIKDADSTACLMGRSVFSTRDFRDASDKAAVITYLFDKLKHQFIHEVVNGQLHLLFMKE